MNEPAPRIKSRDIAGRAQQVNHVTLYSERSGVKLRYSLRIDSHIGQSHFMVEAYHRESLTWIPQWSIPPTMYRFTHDPYSDYSEATDPATLVIASPYSRDVDLKVTSWQKIVRELTDYMDMLLSQSGE